MNQVKYRAWNKLIDESWVLVDKCNTATEFFNVVSKNLSPLHSSASLVARILVEHNSGGFKRLIDIGLGPSMYRMVMLLISLKKERIFNNYIDGAIKIFKEADRFYYEYLDVYESAAMEEPEAMVRSASIIKCLQVLDREFVKMKELLLEDYNTYINSITD